MPKTTWCYQSLNGLAEMQESALWLRVCLDDLLTATSDFISGFGETPLPDRSRGQLPFLITQIHELNERINKLILETGRVLFSDSTNDTLFSPRLLSQVTNCTPAGFTRLNTINAIDQLLIAYRQTRTLILLSGSIACDIFEHYSPPSEEESSDVATEATSSKNEQIAEGVPCFINEYGLSLPHAKYSAWVELDHVAWRLGEDIASYACDLHALMCELETECPRDIEILKEGESPESRGLTERVSQLYCDAKKRSQQQDQPQQEQQQPPKAVRPQNPWSKRFFDTDFRNDKN
jgi:hypothetical protein